MADEEVEPLAARDIPDAERHVVGRGHDPVAIRQEADAIDIVRVAFQALFQLAAAPICPAAGHRRRLSDDCRVIAATRD